MSAQEFKIFPFMPLLFKEWDENNTMGIILYNVELTSDFAGFKKFDKFDSVVIDGLAATADFYKNEVSNIIPLKLVQK